MDAVFRLYGVGMASTSREMMTRRWAHWSAHALSTNPAAVTQQCTRPQQSHHCVACRSVDKNQLTGSIPASWSQLHNLYAVDVTSNEGLCGAVPDGINGVVGFDANYSTTHCPWTDDGECGPAYSSACKRSHGRQQPLPSATACMTVLLCMTCIAGCGTLCPRGLPS